MRRKTVLVVGGYGLVGEQIFDVLRHHYKNRYYTVRSHHKTVPYEVNGKRCHINLLNESTFDLALAEVKPDIVYLCAAFTNVDKCEDCPQAFDVNMTGTLKFIKECQRRNIRVVFFSSSYVFDGNNTDFYFEDDLPNPRNKYGQYKLEAENHVLARDDGLVIRTVGVFGEGGKNFKSQVLSINDAMLYVPTDQFMNPIHARDLAKLSIKVEEMGLSGIINIAGDRCVSKYWWARGLRQTHGMSDINILPVDGEHQKAKRPKNACLSINKLRRFIPNVQFNYPELSIDH